MATASKSRHVLLTGPPGVGKTTLVQKACDTLRQRGVEVQGFYTQERRERGSRTGFDVVTLDGQRAPLATISDDSMPSTRREYRVGKYTVQLHTFENIALPTLKAKVGEKHAVVIIDEIGKMELFSESFKQAVRGVISQPHTTVLATIPIAKGRPIPFVEDIRTRKDAQLFTVSRENRNGLLDEIVSTILSSHLTSTS